MWNFIIFNLFKYIELELIFFQIILFLKYLFE